jgi:hypothetical protein
MSKLVLVAGIALCFCSPARGQDFSRVEIFGGYSYQNADTNNLASPSRQSANGWDASVSWNYNKWFGLEGDFSGHYNTESVPSTVLIPQLNTPVVDLHVHDFTYLGGRSTPYLSTSVPARSIRRRPSGRQTDYPKYSWVGRRGR